MTAWPLSYITTLMEKCTLCEGILCGTWMVTVAPPGPAPVFSEPKLITKIATLPAGTQLTVLKSAALATGAVLEVTPPGGWVRARDTTYVGGTETRDPYVTKNIYVTTDPPDPLVIDGSEDYAIACARAILAGHGAHGYNDWCLNFVMDCYGIKLVPARCTELYSAGGGNSAYSAYGGLVKSGKIVLAPAPNMVLTNPKHAMPREGPPDNPPKDYPPSWPWPPGSKKTPPATWPKGQPWPPQEPWPPPQFWPWVPPVYAAAKEGPPPALPPGAIVFFDASWANSGNGHVAIMDADGTTVLSSGTDHTSVAKYKQPWSGDLIAVANFTQAPFLGYTTPEKAFLPGTWGGTFCLPDGTTTS